MKVSGDINNISFLVESVVHRDIVDYSRLVIWNSVLCEELQCHCEVGNVHDLYMVSLIKPGTDVVGYILQ